MKRKLIATALVLAALTVAALCAYIPHISAVQDSETHTEAANDFVQTVSVSVLPAVKPKAVQTAEECDNIADDIMIKVNSADALAADDALWKLYALPKFGKVEDAAPDMTYIGTYKITGYDPHCVHCCGKSDGVTASGAQAVAGYTVAMYGLDFGTLVYIDGLGTFEVMDKGVGPGVIDVACESHAACYPITGNYDVWIMEV